MKLGTHLRIVCLIIILATLHRALHAADMGDPSVFEGTGWQTYVVDPTNGNDNNDGSASAPFKTIDRAVNQAIDTIASSKIKIELRSGVYRPYPVRFFSPGTANALLIEGVSAASVIFTGADRITNWMAVGGGVCATPWEYNFGFGDQFGGAPMPAQYIEQIGRRAELVFVNNTMLTQVLSLDEVVAGTYYVDEAGDRLYVKGYGGEDLTSSSTVVDVTTRILKEDGAFKSMFVFNQWDNICFKNITFARVGGVHNAALQVWNSTNMFFD